MKIHLEDHVPGKDVSAAETRCCLHIQVWLNHKRQKWKRKLITTGNGLKKAKEFSFQCTKSFLMSLVTKSPIFSLHSGRESCLPMENKYLCTEELEDRLREPIYTPVPSLTSILGSLALSSSEPISIDSTSVPRAGRRYREESTRTCWRRSCLCIYLRLRGLGGALSRDCTKIQGHARLLAPSWCL